MAYKESRGKGELGYNMRIVIKGKIGVVVDCDSDLHAFKGSWYCCTVDFEGTLVKTFSGAFLTTY